MLLLLHISLQSTKWLKLRISSYAYITLRQEMLTTFPEHLISPLKRVNLLSWGFPTCLRCTIYPPLLCFVFEFFVADLICVVISVQYKLFVAYNECLIFASILTSITKPKLSFHVRHIIIYK